MATFAELRDRLSPDVHKRGKQFERVCKWLLETDPRYANRLSKVWLWDDWPGRWGPDCGIDLVAEDRDGKKWAIQARCHLLPSMPVFTSTKRKNLLTQVWYEVSKFIDHLLCVTVLKHQSINLRLNFIEHRCFAQLYIACS